MDEFSLRSRTYDPDDDPFSAETADPAVSAAIIAAAVLVLSCAVFVASGLPARLHAAVAHAPVAEAPRVMPARAPRAHY